VLLGVFSAGVPRLSSDALAQRSQSNVSPQPDNQSRGQQNIISKRQEIEARVPTTDYDSLEPTNPAEKIKRKNRNKHYDGRNFVMSNPSNSGSATILDNEVFFDLPALPVGQSDVIVTGDILTSEAHLSNDKTGVYSEFDIQVDEVLKGTLPTLSKTNLISVSRPGGVVRYPSGHKELYGIAHQNMPSLGKRYLFFLKAVKDTQDYEIVTGYEIYLKRVRPLDFGARFESFSGADLADFLNKIRDAIANKN